MLNIVSFDFLVTWITFFHLFVENRSLWERSWLISRIDSKVKSLEPIKTSKKDNVMTSRKIIYNDLLDEAHSKLCDSLMVNWSCITILFMLRTGPLVCIVPSKIIHLYLFIQVFNKWIPRVWYLYPKQWLR